MNSGEATYYAEISEEIRENVFAPICKMTLKIHYLTSMDASINSAVFGKSLREMRHYQNTGNGYKSTTVGQMFS